ncbi:hypothetical protein ANN_16325 [Periplaneta americana]|uniref:Uncharacterized protein n=1 Tax=Periplaneta americana TaxID=6978 RepID=A0ABQ8SIQ3_PERAM|nr:hypothetical protein ANN_16325 [Periplaneta americana]
MSSGSSTESYPAFARNGLRENPGKNLNQVTCPDRDSNPGHLVSRPDALTVTPQVWTRPNRSAAYSYLNYLIEREREGSLVERENSYEELDKCLLNPFRLLAVRNFFPFLSSAGHVARISDSRNAYGVLVGRPEGKRSLGRPRRRWEDNIEMDLRRRRVISERGGVRNPIPLQVRSHSSSQPPTPLCVFLTLGWGDNRLEPYPYRPGASSFVCEEVPCFKTRLPPLLAAKEVLTRSVFNVSGVEAKDIRNIKEPQLQRRRCMTRI